MRRALLICAFLLLASPALALPGPDPVTGPFSISISNNDGSSSAFGQVVERLEFSRGTPTGAAGSWDFGDREGYRCAYVERFGPGTQVLYTVTFEVFRPTVTSSVWAKINDKNGPDSNDNDPRTGPSDYCGVSGPAATYNAEDHFPHMTHPGDGLSFSDGGFIPLTQAECDRFYWTPGDEAGEVIGWWDEDGPEHAHSDGSAPLPCGGGGDEPIPVLRGDVQLTAAGQAAGITYCAHSAHEDLCSGPAPSPSPSPSPTPSPSPSPTPPPTPVAVVPAGTFELRCPDGSNPEILDTAPLTVTC